MKNKNDQANNTLVMAATENVNVTKSKGLEGYIPFYLGVECQTPEGIDVLKGVYHNSSPVFYNTVKDYPLSKIKPILRPLLYMTKEEGVECGHWDVAKTISGAKQRKLDAERTAWLCARGFDVFDLHSVGLCLYRDENGDLF